MPRDTPVPEPMSPPPPWGGERDGVRDARRAAIRQWLSGKSPPLAELYEAAVRLLHDRSLPGRVILISHAVRDIGNRLPEAVSGVKSERLDYVTKMDGLAAAWRNAGIAEATLAGPATSPSPAGVAIPVDSRLLTQIGQLVAEHEAARARPGESAGRLYAAFTPTNAKRREELRPAILQWIKVTKWFVGRAHAGTKADADHDFDELRRKFDLFETALAAMAQSFYETVSGLDANLKEPSPENVDRVVAMLGHAEQVRYLLDKLDDPLWLRPLYEKGFFKAPPPPDEDPSQGTIGFPLWPQSRFLARAAKIPEAQELVLKVALAIETKNVRIHEDLADVALALPPAQGVMLARRAEDWLESPFQMLLPEKLGELVRQLLAGGETSAGLRLAKNLLRVDPDPSRAPAGGAAVMVSPQPRGRFHIHHYAAALKSCAPALVRAGGEDALQLLCDLLATAIKLSQTNPDGAEDYSWIWRPRIEESEGSDVRDLLVSAVRDGACELAGTSAERARKVVHLLEARAWCVFRRISLRVLADVWRMVPDVAATRLGIRELFDDRHFRHEYAALAKASFAGVEAATREAVIGWIRAGPDIEAYARRYEEALSRSSTAEERAQFVDLWRRARMAPVAAALPLEMQGQYNLLVAKYGPQEDEPRREMAELVHSESPKSAAELREMSRDELAKLLAGWTPDPKVFEPSTDGLARELTGAVVADPQHFADGASALAAISSPLLRALFLGWRDAAAQGKTFRWDSVLALAASALQRTDQSTEGSWTRSATVDLIAAGLRDRPGCIPQALRRATWQVLKPLTDDLDPSPRRESDAYSGSNVDPLDVAINSVRGKALEATIQYGLWVMRGMDQADAAARAARGFDDIPEIRETLERHLGPAVDPSPAIRSVIGRWFPWIALLDRDWALKHVSSLFPVDSSLAELRDAAWDSYVTFCRAFDDVFPLLEIEYRRAVEALATREITVSDPRDPSRHLAEHLMALYWRRRLTLEPGGLLERFFAVAPDGVLGRALEYAGHSLHEMKETLAREEAEHMQQLWLYRWNVASKDLASHSEEISAFGWWFASAKFDAAWALEQLGSVLRAGGRVEPEPFVAEELARLSHTHALEATRCLKALIDNSRDAWLVLAIRERIRVVLAGALSSSDPVTEEEARRLVDQLGASGHHEFRDLLDQGAVA